MNIIPGILTKTFEKFSEQLEIAKPMVEWVQIDVADGKFVNNTTIGLTEIPSGTLAGISSEAHLMVNDPLAYLEDAKRLKIKRIIFHYEAVASPQEIIKDIKKAGFQVAIAVNPETKISEMESLLGDINAILLMSIHPGKQGQEFITEILVKISEIRMLEPDLIIGIDGGVKEFNIEKLAEYKPDYVVVGSGIWATPDPNKTLERLKEKLKHIE